MARRLASISNSKTHAMKVTTVSKKQKGFTLIELLVAIVISLVMTLAAFSALMISRQGFTAVDSAAQLKDTARFSIDLIQRLGAQTGYLSDRSNTYPAGSTSLTAPPNVSGFNNALVDAASPAASSVARGSASLDGSDVLVLMYQPNEIYPNSGTTDRSMINCAGNTIATVPVNNQDRIWSVLHVAVATDGEPSLYCAAGRTSAGSTASINQPIIRGVESFQVLYGVDTVTAGIAPAASAATPNVVNAYLRADQMTVAGNTAATNANWKRVRSIRIGMVLRGPLGSSSVTSDKTTTYYPLGIGADSVSGAKGSALSAIADVGTIFTPGADTRLRQIVTFTIHLRNNQNV